MTRLFGDEEAATVKLGEVTQGIGYSQLAVQEAAISSPTRVLNTTIGDFSTIATQEPTGTGDAGKIIVNYGVGGSTSGGEFSVDGAGITTTNAPALDIEYNFRVDLRLGRASSPQVAIPLARFMYASDGIQGNAVQVGGTFGVEIDDQDTIWRESFDLDFVPAIGSIFFIELARDESGNNSSGLLSVQPSGTLSGWNPVPTARMRIFRRDLV